MICTYRFLLPCLLLLILSSSGCGGDDGGECDSDRDCRGDDVCERGRCVDDDDEDGDWDGGLPDGDLNDGDAADGDPADGDDIDGDGTDGDQPDGDRIDGDHADGDAIDGDDADGDLPDGDDADGDDAPSDGDLTDGDLIDWDDPDGDEPDGDVIDGDESDGDIEIDIDDEALLINEVKYDEVGEDTGIDMFIELYGQAGLSLDACSLVAVNGNDGLDYESWDLSGFTIPGDHYFVLASSIAEGSTASNADMQVDGFNLQNSPDSVELRCSEVVIDTVCYYSDQYDAGKPFLSPCEGAGYAPDAYNTFSLARRPDHNDTDNNANDFALCELPTPGSSNDSCFGAFNVERVGDE